MHYIGAVEGTECAMSKDTTYETYISVNEPIEVLARILGTVLHDAEDEKGPVRYAEADAKSARFTLFAYRDWPAWSHIQSSRPYDEESVAEFLSSLGIQEEAIGVAVDDRNVPLQDLDAIRESVARRRATTRH